MARTVRKLTGLEIDEVSLVDRSANQHATVAIAKRDGEQSMGIFDAEGYEVDEADLGHGDVVYDEDGNEFVHVIPEELTEEDVAELQSQGVTDDDLAELLDEGVVDDADELVGVGKASWSPEAKAVGQALNRGADRVATHVGRNRATYAGVAGARYGYGLRGRADKRNAKVGAGVAKGLGESVYEELSKAFSAGDQATVVSKALEAVDAYRLEAQEATTIAKALADERDTELWRQHVASYGPLPMGVEELAEIMKSASATLPRSQVEKMDRMFSSMGEQLFAELGTSGGAGSDTYDMVEALADQHVGKSDLSREQAIVGIFETNPDAYDTYLSEQKG